MTGTEAVEYEELKRDIKELGFRLATSSSGFYLFGHLENPNTPTLFTSSGEVIVYLSGYRDGRANKIRRRKKI